MRNRIHGGKKKTNRVFFETLERRQLLAATIVNAKTATLTDVDGDKVTVSVTAGTLTLANFTTATVGLGDQLQLIDLSAGGFDGANLTVKVTRVAGGDGLVNVGYINSGGHNLGAVSVAGDLGKILAGEFAITNPGVKSLSVRSMGRMSLDSQGGAGDLNSAIFGNGLGSLTVTTDFVDAFLSVTGKISGGIKIGGSISGNDDNNSGSIQVTSDIGSVKIGRDVRGAGGANSGFIQSTGNMGSVTVGGSILGGTGDTSGYILSFKNIGAVKVTGDIIGGDGQSSGWVHAEDNISSLSVGGSLIGGAGDFGGSVFAEDNMGAAKVGGNLAGGAGDATGQINAGLALTTVVIGGSVLGSTGNNSGVVFSSSDMNSVKIGGSVIGGSGLRSAMVLFDNSVKSISIGGSLIGGTGNFSGKIFAGADIGTLTIGGSIVGGAGEETGQVSTDGNLASITVGRDVLGGTDFFTGVIAAVGELGAAKIGGSLIGGTADTTGVIRSGQKSGTITIAGSIVGGSIAGVASLSGSGAIISHAGVKSITISGSINAGTDTSTGDLEISGGIFVDNEIASLTVKGNLIGNATAKVSIVSGAMTGATATKDESMGTINITGDVKYAQFLAGFNDALNPIDPTAQIKSITVGGDWSASSILCGAEDGLDGFAGTNDDEQLAPAGSPVAEIKSVTIKGLVFGTNDAISNTDHYGIVARRITSVKIGGAAISLNSTDSTDIIDIGPNGDMTILEV